MSNVLAVFDFDGTLTRRDTLGPFLARSRGRHRVAQAALRHTIAIGRAAAGIGSRDEAKARLLRTLYRNVPVEPTRATAEEYATHVLATGMRNDTLARLEWHQSQGHTVIMITASLSLYAQPIAQQLGISTVYATTLAQAGDRFTGELVGENVRGPEKARLLHSHQDGASAFVYAYGDSSGDRELLAAADCALLVRGVHVSARPSVLP